MAEEQSRGIMIKGAFDRLEAVYRVYLDIEEQVQKEIDGISLGRVPGGEVLKIYCYLEYMQANVGRQSMLTMVCAWLEEVIDMLGKDAIPEYTAKVKSNDGGWFKKSLKVWQEHGVEFDGIAEECTFMESAIEVRNCVVHAGGRIERCRNPKRLTDVVTWLIAKAKEGNFNYASIRDGLLYLGDNLIAEAIVASEQVIRHLYDHRGEIVRKRNQ